MRTVATPKTCTCCANYRTTGVPMEFDYFEPCYECEGNGFHLCPACDGRGVLRGLTNICPVCHTDTSEPLVTEADYDSVDDVIIDGDGYDAMLAEQYGMSAVTSDYSPDDDLMDDDDTDDDHWDSSDEYMLDFIWEDCTDDVVEDMEWEERFSLRRERLYSRYEAEVSLPPAPETPQESTTTAAHITLAGAWQLLSLMGAEVLEESDTHGNITLVASRGKDLHIAQSRFSAYPALLQLIDEMNNEDAAAFGY